MASQMAILCRTRTLAHTLTRINSGFKTITTSPILSQEPQIADPDPGATPLPPNPASGSPLYDENWRSPIPPSALIPLGFLQSPNSRIRTLAITLEPAALEDQFADWTASRHWSDIKELFEAWVRELHKPTGKPNIPDVNIFNHYLSASLMLGANADELQKVVAEMAKYNATPNTASFNLVLKAMYKDRATDASLTLLEQMLRSGKDSRPNDESYNLVLDLLLQTGRIDEAFKCIDSSLKSGYTLSVKVFTECVKVCVNRGRLDALVSIIDKCQSMDQNKALCPPWNLSNYIAEVALQEDNGKLAYHALVFMGKLLGRGEQMRPPVLYSVDEGLLVSALGTASRTFDSSLVDLTWMVLRRSLRDKKAPNAETFLAKIYALASLGNLHRAFTTLRELESAYENSGNGAEEELFCPFTSLYPLAVACSKNGFETLDSVYFQLENLSRANPPYKSVAALNCIVLGCANIWDLDRAYQTFEAISSSFGLNPNVHSYNSLMYAFGKLKKTFEASKVFDHMLSLGIKPNATSYSLLVDAHLINRDQKAAISVLNDMVKAGFEPSKEILKKVRRRCVRQMDSESDDRVNSLASKFNIRLGSENRRDTLFNLQYGTEYAS